MVDLLFGFILGWILACAMWAFNWENLVSVEDVVNFYDWLVEVDENGDLVNVDGFDNLKGRFNRKKDIINK